MMVLDLMILYDRGRGRGVGWDKAGRPGGGAGQGGAGRGGAETIWSGESVSGAFSVSVPLTSCGCPSLFKASEGLRGRVRAVEMQ